MGGAGRTSYQMKRTPLKPQSKTRAGQYKRYLKIRREYLVEHPLCEVCRREPSNQIHHKGGRNGPKLLITELWLAICSKCHTKIHNEGAWARTQGLLL